MLLGSVGAHVGSAAPGASAVTPHTAAPTSVAAPAAVPSRPPATSVGGASCPNSTRAAGADPSAGAPHPAGTGPSPQFNTQVQPYATLTGPYNYVAAGAALRDLGYGLINLTWPGGSTANLVAAYMVWAILNDSVPPSNATVNGNPVTGTWTAYATPSPCWSPTYLYTFIADVTSDVVNGVNNLTGFPSAITTGANPWASTQSELLDEGATLIAIYDAGPTIHEVTIMTGALPVSGTGPIATLNYSAPNSTAAKTTYIVADGQDPGNAAAWNGTQIDPNAFPGDDPKETATAWTYGNLSDTRTYNVNVSLNTTSVTAQVSGGSSGDCLNWVGQVLDVQVPARPGPYNVTFVEQGLVAGTPWNVTANGVLDTSTAGAGPTPVTYVLGNGTYSYTVGGVPGYIAQPTSGSVHVAGGPLLLRVVFHQEVYQVTFNETGLPTFQTWSVTVFNSTNAIIGSDSVSTPAGMSFVVANGTYNYTPAQYGLWQAVPPTGQFTVSGTPLSVTVVFEPPPLYDVTFVEQNLTPGTRWGGNIYTDWVTSSNSTTNASFSLQLPNGTTGQDAIYPYGVPGFYAPYALAFAVYGGPTTVFVNFSLDYGVRLNSTGLPANEYWSGTIDGVTTGYEGGWTTNGTIYWAEPNGSYTFTVTSPWPYGATPASGSLTVAGANVTVVIAFALAPTYSVTINETGLAAGSLWKVGFNLPNGSEIFVSSTTTSLVVDEPNGSYSYVPTAVGYTAYPDYGYAYISGANLYESVSFTQVFAVVFTESGLPSGTYWEVEFNGAYAGGYGANTTFYAGNGSYDFYVYSEDGFTPNPTEGTLYISGAGVTQAIVYSDPAEPVYTVTFTETGLPAGTNWSVELNYYSEYTTDASLVFYEANGTFEFYVSGGGTLTPNPSEGEVTVSGADTTQAISWGTTTAATFAVTFTESNLPNGASWYVNISGEPALSTTVSGSSGTTLSISLPNGSYTFTAATGEKGWTNSAGPGFSVAGTTVGVAVSFTAPPAGHGSYEVTFTESGLPSGASWYVNITGEPSLSTTVSGSGTSEVSITLVNGSYTYTVASGLKNWSASSPGNFQVTGGDRQISVAFTGPSSTTPPPTSSGSSGGFPVLWIGIGALIGFLALLLFFLAYRRRRKENPPPPQTPVGPGNPPA